MRLYTIETNGMAKVAVGMDDAMYTVDSFGVDVRDMNELICNFISRTMILWINWITKLSLA